MITFIVPTIGRDTLQNTIDSLIAQENPEWKAIVVFDGMENIKYNDRRIMSISVEKCGKLNHAGLVRNIALNLVNTEWVAFVDDDDTISKDYVSRFKEEVDLNPEVKCIIFRMKTKYDPDKILPAPNHNNFIKNKVGISFTFKKELNLKFEPSLVEDFMLLNQIRSQNHKIVISPYVTYFVREVPCAMPSYKRVFIN